MAELYRSESSPHLRHRQQSRNTTLIKDEIGRGRQTTYDLPPDNYTYGRQDQNDFSSAGDAFVWHGHRPSAPSTPPTDYQRVNKAAVSHHATTPKKLSKFRAECGDMSRLPTPSRTAPRVIPSDVIPDWTYGKPNRPSTPIQAVLSNEAGRESEEFLEDRYLEYEAQRAASSGKFKIKRTKAAGSQRYQEPERNPGPMELWKMSKFDKVGTHIQKEAPLVRDSDGRLRRVGTRETSLPQLREVPPESNEERQYYASGREAPIVSRWVKKSHSGASLHMDVPVEHERRRAKDGRTYTQTQFEEKFGSLALLTEWNDLPSVDFAHDATMVHDANKRCRFEERNYEPLCRDGFVPEDGTYEVEEYGDPSIVEHKRRRAKDGKLYTQAEFEAKFGSLSLLTEWNDLPEVDFVHERNAHRSIHVASRNKYREKFDELDISGDGKLDFDEMKRLLRIGNPGLSDSELRLLFRHVDRNDNGLVDFDEFYDYLHEGIPDSRDVIDAAKPRMEQTNGDAGKRSMRTSTEVTFFLLCRVSSHNDLAGVATGIERGIRSTFDDSTVKVIGWAGDNERQKLREKKQRYTAWGQGAVEADGRGEILLPLRFCVTLWYTSQEELEEIVCALAECIPRSFSRDIVQVQKTVPPLLYSGRQSPSRPRSRGGTNRHH